MVYSNENNSEDSIIKLILDTSWYFDMDSTFLKEMKNFQDKGEELTLFYFAKTAGYGLDEKQTAAYEIISASFMLKAIENYSLLATDSNGDIQKILNRI